MLDPPNPTARSPKLAMLPNLGLDDESDSAGGVPAVERGVVDGAGDPSDSVRLKVLGEPVGVVCADEGDRTEKDDRAGERRLAWEAGGEPADEALAEEAPDVASFIRNSTKSCEKDCKAKEGERQPESPCSGY